MVVGPQTGDPDNLLVRFAQVEGGMARLIGEGELQALVGILADLCRDQSTAVMAGAGEDEATRQTALRYAKLARSLDRMYGNAREL